MQLCGHGIVTRLIIMSMTRAAWFCVLSHNNENTPSKYNLCIVYMVDTISWSMWLFVLP